MKTIYVLETLDELLKAIEPPPERTDCPSEHPRPKLKGSVSCTSNGRVEITGDPSYQFDMGQKEFAIAMSEKLGIRLVARDNWGNP